jgi:hypothetical protein
VRRLFALALLVSCSSQRQDAPTPATPCELAGGPIVVRFDPPSLVLAPGASRPVRVVIEPDVCSPTDVRLAVQSSAIAAAPATVTVDPTRADPELVVTGAANGETALTATIDREDGATGTADLAIDVRDGAIPTCDPGSAATSHVDAASPSARGPASLADAALDVPAAAFTRADELALPPFDATVACDATMAERAGLLPLGPAVRFGGSGQVSAARALRRELSFAIPLNPAAFPSGARLRHLRVLYEGPRAKTPRPIAVASAHIERTTSGGYVLRFEAPWLGTYQAAVAADAGSKKTTRHLTHRALFGISMGAGGAASAGLLHHDAFDTIAMLGGPVDWNWLLWYVEAYALGGFCRAGATCTTTAPGAYPIEEPFVHTMDFDHLWFQDGDGTGGIPRAQYGQMLTDLALSRGNPIAENADPELSFLPAGARADTPFVTGDQDCGGYTLSPIANAPDEATAQAREAQCNAARCDPKRTLAFPSGYYDDEYNPDGSEQVISFCDGYQAPNAVSPYKDVYAPPLSGAAMPVSFAFAVDRNKNGIRDPGEPILRSGHEPYRDVGPDGLADADEPGYDAESNPDPNQDDYEPQINPTGAEGNHRHDDGEPYDDFGLDGVPDSAAKSVVGDVGEKDGAYTESRGLRGFRAVDPHAIVMGWSAPAAAPLTADALARLRFWTDGGVRDFLNFAAAARHLHGAIEARAPGTSAFVNGFGALPGTKPTFSASDVVWADLPHAVGLRYGAVDASPADVAKGDGQHVGTGDQILSRLGVGYAFVGRAGPDADRRPFVDEDPDEAAPDCEKGGRCDFSFTGPKSGRTAPVTVVFPPGYAGASRKDERYPVVYVLHGYGQGEEDVSGLALLTTSAMRDGARSVATRLPRFIVVYVDGRCRTQNGQPDCISGTFFFDSDRKAGPKALTWMLELIDHVDGTYRTMAPADVEEID